MPSSNIFSPFYLGQTLMVLLVVATGTGQLDAVSSRSSGTFQLCGQRLADTLELVCSGRGFSGGKRNAPSFGMDALEDEGIRQNEQTGLQSHQQMTVSKRRVVDECCRQSCSYQQLESYCGPRLSQSDISEELLRLRTPGVVTPSPYAPRRPVIETDARMGLGLGRPRFMQAFDQDRAFFFVTPSRRQDTR